MPNKRKTEHTSVPGLERLNQWSRRPTDEISTAAEVAGHPIRPNKEVSDQFPLTRFRVKTYQPKTFAIKNVVFTGQVNLEQYIKIGKDNWTVRLISSGQRLDVVVTPAGISRSGSPHILTAVRVWSSENPSSSEEDDFQIPPAQPNCSIQMKKPTCTSTVFVSVGVQIFHEK